MALFPHTEVNAVLGRSDLHLAGPGLYTLVQQMWGQKQAQKPQKYNHKNQENIIPISKQG